MQTFLSAARMDLVIARSEPMPVASSTATSHTAAVATALNTHFDAERQDPQPSPPAGGLNEELIASLPSSALDALESQPRSGAIAWLAQPSDQSEQSVSDSWQTFVSPTLHPAQASRALYRPLDGVVTTRPAEGSPSGLDHVATPRDANVHVASPEVERVVTQRQGDIYYDTHKTWVLDAARKAGLDANQIQKLESILRNSKDFDADVKLLGDLLATENPARTLRTFNDLDVYRRQHPDRITPEIVRALTLGVGQARTEASQGNEGILGNASAINAAEALVRMSPADYSGIYQALSYAGRGFGEFPPDPGSDMQKEMALILKAAAARVDRFTDHFMWDTKREPSNACAEVVQFAQKIRARNADELIQLTTALDLNGDGVDVALQQRWNNSCVETVLQMARAEADPIYALELNREVLHSTSPSGAIAKSQRFLLNEVGGTAVPRDSEGGRGTTDVAWDLLENRVVSSVTGRAYEQRKLEPTAQSRTYAVDYMEQLLKTGTDVPIGVEWSEGGSHALFVTDVRGKGEDREFLVTDPWNGKTDWIRCDDISNGNTDFFGVTGTLTVCWF